MNRFIFLVFAILVSASITFGATMPRRDRIIGNDAGLDAARGLDSAVRVVNLYGENADLDSTGTPTMYEVWMGDRAYTENTYDNVVYFKSGDTDDSETGTGARYVYIEGINKSYTYQSETIHLNGTSASTTSNRYMKINVCRVSSAGSKGYNDGAITGRMGTTVNALTYITAKANVARAARYVVPDNKSVYIQNWGGSSESYSSRRSFYKLQVKDYGGVWRDVDAIHLRANVEGPFYRTLSPPVAVAEKGNVRVIAGDFGSTDNKVYVNVRMLQEDD